MTTTVIRNADWIVAFEGGAHRYATGDVAFDGDTLIHVGGAFDGEADARRSTGAALWSCPASSTSTRIPPRSR